MKYERLTYENNHGTKIEFGDGSGIYVNTSDIRDYEWKYTTANNRIKRFYNKVTKHKLPVRVLAPNEETAIALKNSLCDVADRDVVEGEYGKIWIGEYYLPCYVIASKKKNYSKCGNYLETSLTIISDTPRWIKESTIYYRNVHTAMLGGVDYAYDYAFDYGTEEPKNVVNSSYAAEDFKIAIYGACSTCLVKIGDNTYSVDVALKTKERLEIDSREKTVYHYDSLGNRTSVFDKRDKTIYIFQKIPVGSHTIERDTMVDVTLYEERSEPLWT